jgi:hypothetical protein
MTDRIALGLALAVLAAVGIDVALAGTDHLLYLGTKFVDLVDYIAFWR